MASPARARLACRRAVVRFACGLAGRTDRPRPWLSGALPAALIVVAGLVALGSGAAFAQPAREWRGLHGIGAAEQRAALLPPPRVADRGMPPRGGFEGQRQERREAMRHERMERREERMQQRREHMERRERMTPDERRSLRRDLNDAGRDLYQR